MKLLDTASFWIARLTVGLVLVYSGSIKVARPYDFLNNIFQYELVGPSLATWIAAVLPFIELTVGLALVTGVFGLGAAALASLMMMIFTVTQSSALLRGLEADCACFGAGEKVGWTSLLRTAVLFGAAVITLVGIARRGAAVSVPSGNGARALAQAS